MLSGVIAWSLSNRALVIALFVLMALSGLYAATQIPVDAVPDLVNVQVQVVTEAGTLPPLEVERLITYPVELAMSGLPSVEEVRSVSRLGISSVTIVFREGTDILRARQLVAERLPAARGRALTRTIASWSSLRSKNGILWNRSASIGPTSARGRPMAAASWRRPVSM